MKHNMIPGLLAAALMMSAVPAFAAEELPDNLTIAPNPVIAPNPRTKASRSMAVSRLWELSGKPVTNYLMQFEDVTEGTDEAEAIRWAASEGIAVGCGAHLFAPHEGLTREQLATMIYRYVQAFGLGFRGAWMFYLPCEDVSEISGWAKEPMYWMVASKLYDGNAEKLLPHELVSVEELQLIFDGLVKLAADKEIDCSAYSSAQTENK